MVHNRMRRLGATGRFIRAGYAGHKSLSANLWAHTYGLLGPDTPDDQSIGSRNRRGLGVGLSLKSNNSGAGTPTAISISTLSSSSIKEKPTNPPSTSTSPSLSNPNLGRPVNDTLKYIPASNSASSTAYTVNSTTLTYTIHCGFTYNASYNRDGTGSITDLQYIPLTNLSICINLCSMYNIQVPDGGAQYGFYDLCSGITVTNNETCQLKSRVEAGAKNSDLKGDGQSAMLLW